MSLQKWFGKCFLQNIPTKENTNTTKHRIHER